ncbi:MAG: glycosyltransferase [Flavobacterium sp.]|nr:MAG: glycosyltransferase [Flavobacterium sp.]
MPDISIIMPAFNAEIFITESIESIINQTYKNWELIIVDDGSTDKTAEIIKTFRNLDDRIKYIYQENGKQGKARNLGIKDSKGHYIAFLDADDIWTDDKLAIELDEINKQKNVDLIFSQGFNLSENEISECNLLVKEIWDTDDFEKFLDHNQIPILSVLVKKEALTAVKNFTEKSEIQNAEDYHLWLKLLLSGSKFKSIPNRLFYYRIHSNQSTFQNTNLDIPIFNVLIDIYYFTNNLNEKKALINKLKWLLFKNSVHEKCIDLFSYHLKQKGLKLLAFIMRAFLNGQNRMQKRIAFQLISTFG